MTAEPFNPLDMANLGESIATALLRTDPTPIASVKRFHGAGIYALYYNGSSSLYEPLARSLLGDGPGVPIYVGKAMPKGSRKGIEVAERTTALYSRIAEHRKSIEQAENLAAADFLVRWLVTEPIWVPLGESLMIGRYAPVWNRIVDGFGNHDPGGGRRAGMVSRWDVLHPGRPWAWKYAPRPEDSGAIAAEVHEYLRQRIT